MIENKLEDAIKSSSTAADFHTANSYSFVNMGYCYLALAKRRGLYGFSFRSLATTELELP